MEDVEEEEKQMKETSQKDLDTQVSSASKSFWNRISCTAMIY